MTARTANAPAALVFERSRVDRVRATRQEPPAQGDIVSDRYALRREIATGGMSVVFEAEHLVLGRTVACKVAHMPNRSVPLRERMEREARALAVSAHPNVVAVHDAGECPVFGPYLIMEQLQGRTLDGLVAARNRLDPALVTSIGHGIARGLSAAHAAGVVHRDVKPANVFLVALAGGSFEVKVIDFGLARIGVGREEEVADKLTREGSWLGTPEYMAPEQLEASSSIDGRADVYALGVTLFECLAGSLPFHGSFVQITVAKGNTTAPRVDAVRADVPAALADIVAKALERDPGKRFASANELAEALASYGRAHGGNKHAPAAFETAHRPLSAEQRRRYARAPFVTPVVLTADGQAPIAGRSEDISEGGLLVVSPRKLERDSIVSARFALPTTGQIVSVPATIRWVRESFGRVALGLEFVKPPETVRTDVARFIELMVPRALSVCT